MDTSSIEDLKQKGAVNPDTVPSSLQFLAKYAQPVDFDPDLMNLVQLKCDGDGDTCIELWEDAGTLFDRITQPPHILEKEKFQARPEDVLVVTYPKSGTHWTKELCTMLVKKLEKLSDEHLIQLDYIPNVGFEEWASPRVLSCHWPYARIPLDFFRKQSRIVVCVRNPRDVAVSWYEYIKTCGLWNYTGSWDSFLNHFFEGKVPYNSWFEHTDTWMKAVRSGRHSNIHLFFYEDMKTNFDCEIARLATFLGIEPTQERIETLKRETKIDNMKQNKMDLSVFVSTTGKPGIYRKGGVGDWSSRFSPDQIARMDKELEEWGMADKYKFKYTVD